jgi:hypothetical protein
MTRIVTSHYRYKRPPRKRRAVPLEVPAVVTIERKTRRRKSDAAKAAPVESTSVEQPSPAPMARPSTIVTARRPGKRRHADVPEVTEEEHRRNGDLADAMMAEFKRVIAEKVRK